MNLVRKSVKKKKYFQCRDNSFYTEFTKKEIADMFGKYGLMLWEYANGIDNSEVNYLPTKPKGIGNSGSVTDGELLKELMFKILH